MAFQSLYLDEDSFALQTNERFINWV